MFERGNPSEVYTLFYPGSPSGVVVNKVPPFESEQVVIHLYDGSPLEVADEGNHKTVVFAAPESAWVREVRSIDDHVFLSLRPWKLAELVKANEALGLGVAPEKLKSRFDSIGGIARYCLSRISAEFRLAEERIWFNIIQLLAINPDMDSRSGWVDSAGMVLHIVPYLVCSEPFRQKREFAFGSCALRARLLRTVRYLPPELESSLTLKFALLPTLPDVRMSFFE